MRPHSQADGSSAFLPSLHQSAGGLMAHGDSHRMNERTNECPIFLIMTSSLFSDSIHYRLCFVSFAHLHSHWKQILTTDHFSCRLIRRTPRGRKKRHKKTDDSISIITKARFNLRSIQSASSKSIGYLQKFKTPLCLSRFSHLSQFRV